MGLDIFTQPISDDIHPTDCQCSECDPDTHNDDRLITSHPEDFTDDHDGAYMAPIIDLARDDPPFGLDYAKCSSCNAAVIFLPALDTGRTNILDAQPVEGGNVAIVDGKAVFARKDRPLPENVSTYVSHWATCLDVKGIRAQLHAREQAKAKRNSF